MSAALDANILLYASDTGSPFQAAAARFLDRIAAGRELFWLAWPTIMAYLRIATHPSIFAAPLSPGDAMQNIDALIGLPHARVLGEDEGFWQTYRILADDIRARGNLVPDAHLAAILRQHGVNTLYTRDRDFRRFGFLRVVDPFERDTA